jgi:CRISPR type I-E-associated protein CasB/Cse2
MTEIKEKTSDIQIKTFVENLAKLDSGGCARLKRNAGSRLSDSHGGAMGLFYNRLLPPGVGRWAEDWYFLVATLYPLEKEEKGPIPANFGVSLRRVRNSRNEAGLDRRVERLLDADEQQLPFQLRQAVHFLTSNRGRVDWEQLLKDLLQWTRPDRFVQRRWARAYFVKEPT